MPKGHFDHWVTAAHHGKSASELTTLGTDALHGVSAGDGQHLEDAFGTTKVEDLAELKYAHRAARIAEEATGVGYDTGPGQAWASVFDEAPLATYQEHPSDFRLDFGPVYYRGRLDGTARVLVVGQDPAANELVGHRAFVGASGQRLQGFLRRIGIRRDYIMVNTFLYPVFGQFFGTLATLSQNPKILGFRNRMLDRIHSENPLEAVITVGNAAQDAVDRWPGKTNLHVRHITHPSALDHTALFASWNAGLTDLRNHLDPDPESAANPDNATYGTAWTDADHEPIPRRDLPFGVPPWHGDGSHATRARLPDNSTDHKRIVWKAP